MGERTSVRGLARHRGLARGAAAAILLAAAAVPLIGGTELDTLLRALGVDTVVLCGINTNTCVLCTAFDAFNRDLRVIVAADGVASMYGDDLHVFGLQNVQRCLGWVLETDEVLARFRAVPAANRAI